MFPNNFFPTTYFPDNYFGPEEFKPGIPGRERVEVKKAPHKPNEIGILSKNDNIQPLDRIEYKEEFTESLIEDALLHEPKPVETLQEKLRDEEDVGLLLAIVELHEDEY